MAAWFYHDLVIVIVPRGRFPNTNREHEHEFFIEKGGMFYG